jgi:hypothetical protein
MLTYANVRFWKKGITNRTSEIQAISAQGPRSLNFGLGTSIQADAVLLYNSCVV